MDWPRGFSSRLQKAFEEKTFTDVDINVDGRIFSAHRTILIASSDYFLHMLTGGMIEASQSTISISGVSAPVFECVLRFIYSLCCESVLPDIITNENVDELMCAAELFQLCELKEGLVSYISKNLDEQNMLGVFVIGWKYNITILCSRASKLMSSRMISVVLDEHFGLIDLGCAKALFSSPCFTTKHEDEYCRAALTWFYFDQENREKYFPDVMAMFCHHKIKDFSNLKWPIVDRLCEERGYICDANTRCGDNRRCPNNTIVGVKSVEELCLVYGQRYYLLGNNTHLMNTFTCHYSYCGKDLPEEFYKLEVSENRKFSILESQITYMDHHLQVFYQGAQDPEKMILVCGTYQYKNEAGTNTLGKFSRLTKVALIIDSTGCSPSGHHMGDGIINPRYLHRRDRSRDAGRTIWRYPYMVVIGGDEVDMDDAVRFACSLVLSFGTTNCSICEKELSVKQGKYGSAQYIDIWSSALEPKRAEHFGYDLS